MKVAFDVKLSAARWGGVEKQFARFLSATRDDPRIETLLFSRWTSDRHDEVVTALDSLSERAFDARWIGPFVVPKPLRIGRQVRYARRRKVDVVININRFRSVDAARTAAGAGARSIYWERGAAWFSPQKPTKHGFEHAYDLYLANSRAAHAMLRQVWAVDKPIRILAPAVWEFDLDRPQKARSLDAARPLRLGFAGRLRAFKGGVLAVHAVADLRRRGIDAELLVAGLGDDSARMESLATRLGVAEAVKFLGLVRDMGAFYDGIDILLHPALREPYGNVAAEAQCFGLPVVTTYVDGLPEVVADGDTGFCVRPLIAMDDFAALGGNPQDVYPLVYHPNDPARPQDSDGEPSGGPAKDDADGVIGPPRFAAPAALADALAALVASPEIYAGFSRRAIERSHQQFTPAVHIDRFIDCMQAVIAR